MNQLNKSNLFTNNSFSLFLTIIHRIHKQIDIRLHDIQVATPDTDIAKLVSIQNIFTETSVPNTGFDDAKPTKDPT